MTLLFTERLHGILRFPLKRREGLRNKGGRTDGDFYTLPLRFVGICVKGVDHLLSQLRDSGDILQRFRRQPDHKIELDGCPATLKRGIDGFHQLFFRDVFIDNVPQTLCSRLRRKSKTAATDGFDFGHQLRGKIIDPEGRQRNAGVLLFRPCMEPVDQLVQLGVVARTERGKRNLIIARAVAQIVALPVNDVH
jgi:hypothetical protein